MNYPLFNKNGKEKTLRSRVSERKILQDVLFGEETEKTLL